MRLTAQTKLEKILEALKNVVKLVEFSRVDLNSSEKEKSTLYLWRLQP
jgi:hypothetical protein